MLIKINEELSQEIADISFDTEASGVKTLITSVLSSIYPVGSIYMSVNSTNPGTIFGGTWEQIKDTFLLSAGNTYAAGSTGGAATVKLEIAHMPSHTHVQNAHNHGASTTSNGGHSHDARFKGFGGSASASGWYYARRNVAEDSYDGTAQVTTTDGGHSHGISVNNTTATNQNTGGSQAHDNMPPYLAVYVWKRTA